MGTIDRVMIVVKLFASAREIIGVDQVEMTLPDGTTAGDVISLLLEQRLSRGGQASGDISGSEPADSASWLIAVNRRYASRSVVLKENDEMAVLPPVTGG